MKKVNVKLWSVLLIIGVVILLITQLPADEQKTKAPKTQIPSTEQKNQKEDSNVKQIADKEPENGLNNAEKALQLLNHFSTVLYRITDSRDLVLLELEYDRINRDNIFLDVIEDHETISIIQQIMNYITSIRIAEKEREMLRQWLREDLRNAVFSTCPNPSGLITANPKVIAIVTTQYAFSWLFHYMGERKKLLREFAKQSWELDKTIAEELNQLNTELLEKSWILVKKYNIRDVQRITIPELKEFLKHADNNPNDNSVYEFLCLKEEKYKKFPEYWYRRGKAAEEIGMTKEAMNAYRNYQKIYLQFLRKDRMAADVALNLAKLMIDSGDYKKDDMLQQLKIIEDNVNAEDWTYLYFCGKIYLELNENNLAYHVLGITVNELELGLSNQYKEFQNRLKDKEKLNFIKNIPPASYPLVMCRSAYLEAYSKSFSEYELGKKFTSICENEMTSGYELIAYCNKDSKLIQNLPVSLFNNLYTSIAYPDGKIYVHTPINWFYLGNEKMSITKDMKYKEKLNKSLPCLLKVHYENGEVDSIEEDVDERLLRYSKDKHAKEDLYWAKIEFPFKYKWIKKRNAKRIDFAFPLRGLSVTLVYLPKSEDIQLFPLQEKRYSPAIIIINETQISINERSTKSYEEIGKSIKAFFQSLENKATNTIMD